MKNPAEILLELSMIHSVPRCLHEVADLGVADVLDEIPKTAADLAAATGANANALGRALRLLASYGVFETRDDRFAHSQASRLLRADHPQSMRSYVRMIGFPIYWQSFEKMMHTMKTGGSTTEQLTPGGSWAYLAQNPELNKLFDEAMTAKAHGQVSGILANYDFKGFKTIADIGGGRGHLLQAVLQSAPDATGVLFDQPHVVKDVQASSRLKLQGGDFFKDTLPAADLYLIMQVIHDWSDEESHRILSGIRRAAPPDAKLLLIEAIVPEHSDPSWIKMLDIFMMVILTGRERTRSEFQELLRRSGFRLDRVIDVGLGTSILESSVIPL
jgi:hypothetical protein